MTSDALKSKVDSLAKMVAADPRWRQNSDDLGVAVLGMLLYGYSLAVGRLVMLLELDSVAEATKNALVGIVGAAPRWSGGLVQEAGKSAFDRAYHPQNFELIGVGHSYYGVANVSEVIDNIFANIEAVRARVRAAL